MEILDLIISGLAPIFSLIFAYFFFKKQETWKEKRSLTDLFKQFKRDIGTFFIESLLPTYDIPLSSFLCNIPFYEVQQEKLIKLGVIVLNTTEKNRVPISLRKRGNYTCLLVILNKYYIGVYADKEHQMIIEIDKIKQLEALKSIEEVEGMLKEMIEYTKKYFDIKINEKIIDLSEFREKRKRILESLKPHDLYNMLAN